MVLGIKPNEYKILSLHNMQEAKRNCSLFVSKLPTTLTNEQRKMSASEKM